jgi:predicted metal-dependent peptidase
MIKTANDALMIVPLIREYFDIQVKNDEQLVKLASVIQRIMSRQTIGIDGETNGFLTDEEKRQIMSEIESISKANGEIKINKS